ncbi:glycoside hydrolase family protein, putative [Histoplasma capsulatum G186AR]|uniref:Putative glycoside hydrolase family protein n=1 Tax=Ajellomyces capsulatus TaxID=5037 RepID=A0A8H7YF42_AJECA|nr:putative glycoside hydrolase family protein [Histoplasma capsulatum]QSS71052.1 glycoside hydrolase family protein, putative [Histoplasma capsulatum G186AR]
MNCHFTRHRKWVKTHFLPLASVSTGHFDLQEKSSATMAEPLFNFLLIRPHVSQDARKPSIPLLQNSTFQKELLDALKTQTPRTDALKVVKKFVISNEFIADPTGTDFQKKLRQFKVLVDEASSVSNDLKYTVVLELAKRAFGIAASELVKGGEFGTLLQNLRDSVVAIKYDQSEHSKPVEDLVNQIRDLELIEKAVQLEKDVPPAVSSDSASEFKGPVTESTETTAAAGPPEWSENTAYKVGDQVSYDGHVYVCIQAHTTVIGWEPPKTPALWVRVSRPNPDGDPIPPTDESTNLFGYRQRSLLLPTETQLKSVLSEPDSNNDDPTDDTEKEADRLLSLHNQLFRAVKELTAMDPRNFQIPVQDPHDGFTPDTKYSAISLLKSRLDLQTVLRGINVDQFRAAAARSGTTPPPDAPKISAATADPVVAADPLQLQDGAGATSALGLTRELLTAGAGLRGVGKFIPFSARQNALKLQTGVVLSENTTALLQKEGIEPDAVPLPDIVQNLRQKMREAERDLKSLAPSFEDIQITRVGNTLVSVRTPRPSKYSQFLTGINFGRLVPKLPLLPPPDPRVPHTIGKVNKIGVGDLLVVRQQLIGYEGADIAHIENVLKGESKSREHVRTDRTETVTSLETETTQEDTRELASTTRFEMGQETQKQIQEAYELKGGVQVTAKYGPAVEVSANVEGGFNRSKEESTKTATKFSQDVTEKAVKKITERVLQKTTTTITSEVVEKNSHGIDNTAGNVNISGVYQWVNKVYEAQVFNYGLRTLFDFMVPEPAAWVINTMTKAAETKTMLEKPQKFDLEPSQISEEGEDNYGHWVKVYEATDVGPPPADYITATDQINKGDGKPEQDYQHTGQITIESGYEAVHVVVGCAVNYWEENWVADVIVGNETCRFKQGAGFLIPLSVDKQRGTIPWGVKTWNTSSIIVTVDIKCAVTEDATNKWRADTHAKLMTAYKARLQEYEEKLATLQLQQGITIEGRNPVANQATIKQELKKNCISIITGQHFDRFNSISIGPWAYPQINLYEAEAEGEYVRFFEQAFEWEQIMYVMYPYFWGRKPYWAQRLAFEDPDPQFDEFLKAGFARVQVPARLGFEAAIDHFLQFGELWNGGPLPTISSELFLPIADEIAERAQKPGEEIPQGKPWKLRIPTQLVKLRQDDKLPKWIKKDGEWVPDE